MNKTKEILKYLEKDKEELDIYAYEKQNEEYIEFNNEEEIYDFFGEYMQKFEKNNDISDIELLRYYTGIAYRQINALLREKWDYETAGRLTNEKRRDLRYTIDQIERIYIRNEEIPNNIKAYRGVDLSSLQDYGIYNIEDLKSLVGEYYFDFGYSSTSLDRKSSFFDRPLEWHSNCNIEIEYLIPKESDDVIPLITQALSYSKNQTELLINKGNLSKIVDVKISDDKQKAYIKTVLIPKKVWDKSYKEYKDNQKSLN